MKIKRAISFITVIISIACFFIAAEAQSHRIAAASIPFEFKVGKKDLPAGRYYFDRLPSTSDTSILVIRDSDYKPVASMYLSSDHPRGRYPSKVPSLIFGEMGNTKVLALLSDPQAEYLGRAGSVRWKKSLPADSGARVIPLKPVTAGQ